MLHATIPQTVDDDSSTGRGMTRQEIYGLLHGIDWTDFVQVPGFGGDGLVTPRCADCGRRIHGAPRIDPAQTHRHLCDACKPECDRCNQPTDNRRSMTGVLLCRDCGLLVTNSAALRLARKMQTAAAR